MINVKDLRAGYAKKEILHGISVEFSSGRITGLIGLNGSGKSTLLKALVGQLPTTGGSISIDGTDLREMNAQTHTKKLAYFPQNRPLPDMTVETMVAQGCYPRRRYQGLSALEQRRIVDTVLAEMNLTQLKHSRIGEISGGERQRAYLALSMAQDADWLLLDEPVAHLDLPQRSAFVDQLFRLKRAGKGVVLVLHEIDLALTICDRLMLLHEGHCLQVAAPEEWIASGRLLEVFGVIAEKSSLGGIALTNPDWRK